MQVRGNSPGIPPISLTRFASSQHMGGDCSNPERVSVPGRPSHAHLRIVSSQECKPISPLTIRMQYGDGTDRGLCRRLLGRARERLPDSGRPVPLGYDTFSAQIPETDCEHLTLHEIYIRQAAHCGSYEGLATGFFSCAAWIFITASACLLSSQYIVARE